VLGCGHRRVTARYSSTFLGGCVTPNRICAETSCPGCMVINEEGTICVSVPNGEDPKDACSIKEYGCTSLDDCDGQGSCAKRKVEEDCPGGINGECKSNGKCCGKITGICF
ncbi:MAG: hypothetical protein RMJ98_12635, partial [Myxococcales bacterium]|nr:hypothetical protein [Polyangiaceae bacterium]MDW8250133.1 hypothetical protein [Myxococcales bacterium]